VHPRDAPGRFRVRGGEDLEATGRVGGDQLVATGAHRRVDGVAGAERLATTLAGAMAGVERIGTVQRRLHRALRIVEETVADGEGTGLVELDLLMCHVVSP